MAKTPVPGSPGALSQRALYMASGMSPNVTDPVTQTGIDMRNQARTMGQDPWGNQGTPGGPVMSPQWPAFFDAINKYAPGGITMPRGKRSPVTEEA